MVKIVILVCSLIHPHPHGCGPSTAEQAIDAGTAASEGDCNVKGRVELAKHPDDAEHFHKLICIIR